MYVVAAFWMDLIEIEKIHILYSIFKKVYFIQI